MPSGVDVYRGNLENMSGHHASGPSFRQAGPRPMQQERTLPPPDHLPPQWGNSREPGKAWTNPLCDPSVGKHFMDVFFTNKPSFARKNYPVHFILCQQ